VYTNNKKPDTQWVSGFLVKRRFEQSNAARMSAAGDGWAEPNHNFHPPQEDENANESLLFAGHSISVWFFAEEFLNHIK